MLSSEKNMALLGRGSEIYFQLYCYWISWTLGKSFISEWKSTTIDFSSS